MNYNIKLEFTLDGNSLRQLVGTLDLGPHGLVRPIVDSIITQAQVQDSAAQAEQQKAPVDVPTTPEDAPPLQ